jgi:osmoprotectant transport system substrate-binding protein
MSDLAPVADQLVLGGPPECPQRPFCQPGIEQVYGAKFKDFKPLDPGGPLTVAALEGKQVDVALLFSSDAVIAQKDFVVLEDDKKLQAADNVAPVVRDDLLSQAPADFKTLLNGVSAKLTTEELTGLNKQVGVDRMEPRDVAGAWLKAKGLVK